MSYAGYKAQIHTLWPKHRIREVDRDAWATHPDLFAVLDERFHFTIDVAADAENHKVDRFFSIEKDGLSQPWRGERVWCNPPYSDLRRWVQKAWTESVDAQLIVMLVPANRTDQPWWHEHVEPYRDTREPMRGDDLRVEFLPGRTKFIAAGDQRPKRRARPMFGTCLLIWGGE